MPLYELVIIARSQLRRENIIGNGLEMEKSKLKELLKFCAKHVLDNDGVVRQFTNSMPKELPFKMKRHQEIFSEGSYLTMKFDSSPTTMKKLSQALSLNETVIRHTMLNMGSSLSNISSYVHPESVKPLAIEASQNDY